jgi:hypothetical protein
VNHYYEAKRFRKDQFDVTVDWTYEQAALGDCFDETVSDLDSMIDRCNRGIDTHYIARVRVFYAGHLVGSESLGSCYAVNCDPADDIESGIGGYLEDMLAEAVDQARQEVRRLQDRLRLEFPE